MWYEADKIVELMTLVNWDSKLLNLKSKRNIRQWTLSQKQYYTRAELNGRLLRLYRFCYQYSECFIRKPKWVYYYKRNFSYCFVYTSWLFISPLNTFIVILKLIFFCDPESYYFCILIQFYLPYLFFYE